MPFHIPQELINVFNSMVRSHTEHYVVRLARGLTHHSVGKYAIRGISKIVGDYQALSENDKWVADQIIELSTRIALNYTTDEVHFYLTQDALENESENASSHIYNNICSSIQSRAISIGYDEVFGNIQRDGRILVRKDIIKQAIISAVSEMVCEHHN